MTEPTVHLNGTSRDDLRRQYQTAYLTLAPAIAALQTTPHGRDYYPQDGGRINGPVYQAARAEHAERLNRSEAVQRELLTLYQAVTRRGVTHGSRHPPHTRPTRSTRHVSA